MLAGLPTMSLHGISIFACSQHFADRAARRPEATLQNDRDQLNRLYSCLGSIATLRRVSIHLNDVVDPRIDFGQMIGRMSGISVLNVCDNNHTAGPGQIRAIEEGLRNLRSLQKVSLTLPSQYFSIILPTLQTVPTLRAVALCTGCRVVSSEGAQAIANLFATSAQLYVHADQLKFMADAQSIFCQGVIQSGIHGLSLTDCSVVDPA